MSKFEYIPLLNRIRFLILYSIDLVRLRFTTTSEKQCVSLDNRKFKFLGNHISVFLTHLHSHISYYHRYYKNANTIIDIGASFGTFPRIVNFFNPKARIYSLEMSTESFSVLSENCSGIDKIKIDNYAIGEKTSIIKYTLDPKYPEGANIGKIPYSTAGTARQISLDNYIRMNKIGNIDLVKIDAEGYEINVLKGCPKALRSVKVLIVEVKFDTFNLISVLNLMKTSGLQLVDIGPKNIASDGSVYSADLIFRP